MNKKFSTLVAGLLFASALSAYAGTAAPNFTVSTAIETRATTRPNWVMDAPDAHADVKNLLLPEFTDNSRLLVFSNTGDSTWAQATDGSFLMYDGIGIHLAEYLGGSFSVDANAFYFNYANKQLETKGGLVLNLAGYSKFDVVPVSFRGIASNYFVLRAWYDESTPVYINMTGNRTSGTGIVAVDNVSKAALFVSAETAFATTGSTGTVLNSELNGGFSMSVAFGTSTLKGAELFDSKLTAMMYNAADGKFVPASSETAVYLKNNKEDKYLFFNKTLNGTNAVKGGFELLSADDIIAHGTDTVLAKFTIKKADNGTRTTEMSVDTDRRLYVNVSNGTDVLTAAKPADLGTNYAPNWAKTSFGANNGSLDFRTLLTGKYVKVRFVKKADGVDDDVIAYKTNGILGLKFDKTVTTNAIKSDYIKSSSVVAEDPAVMWAPSIDGRDLVLTNRENTLVKVRIQELRILPNASGVYQIEGVTTTVNDKGVEDGEQIKIEFVNSVTKTDGYMVEAENVLRNTSYYLGQSRRNADGDVPAYWAENHGTHQIGATVNQEEATQWRLELLKKEKNYKHIDSVLVVSKLYVYNVTSGITTGFTDTLAVLPYVFQNKGNREYVKLNTEINLKYFMCDDKNKDYPRNAYKFALKKKPGNTFNYFTLTVPATVSGSNNSDATNARIAGDDKVYLKNSLDKGTWENVEAYSDDANSLMVIEKVDAPEYRKVKKEWGDIVKIFREEYPTEVLFEKRDNKSVVDKDTLSFLNVNNSVSGANPALFVDTAYVNRKVNGIENTRYQYLLAVDVDRKLPVYCPHNPEHNTPEWIEENGGPCDDAVEGSSAVKGRFLINLIDTAFSYKQSNLHKNPYINAVEAGEHLAKLSFVEGIHTKDELYLTRKGGEVDTLEMDSPEFNVAKFAFRYVDNKSGSFKIQTLFKNYDEDTKKAFDDSANDNGYLRWINGTIVVTNSYENGETFNMEENYKGNPVTNEPTAVSEVSVIAGTGSVTIKNATGKSVVISNILGQVIANTTITSDNATISVPAGIVVVSVDGEAVKAIVK